MIAAMQAATAGETFLRCDDTYTINIVPPGTPLVPVNFSGNTQSDPGLYAIPNNAIVESGSDAHCLCLDPVAGILYELFGTSGGPGAWVCGSAAKWDLASNALRPDTWTSADAAGLPMTPGVLRYSDILAGSVNHCLRFTCSPTFDSYQWPARHYASHDQTATDPMMGQRFRLNAGFDVSSFSPNMQIVLNGLKTYGCMVADNGMTWGMQHDQDPRWDPNDLVTLHNVLGSNMEAVDVSSLMVDPNSGATTVVPNSVFMGDAIGRANAVPLGIYLEVQAGKLRGIYPIQYVNQPCVMQADNSWLYPQPGRNVQIWRGGALQTPGKDYTLNQSARQIVPTTPWAATDAVLAAYLY
jgi:hypothetical protein